MAPKIKIYQLAQGYTEDGDTDVQLHRADELLPVVDKSTLLQDAQVMTGVKIYEGVELYPVDLAAGEQDDDLVPPLGEIQQLATGDLLDVLPVYEGALAIRIMDGDTEIPHQNLAPPVEGQTSWTMESDGIHFHGDPPDGAKIYFHLKANLPATQWALPNSLLYDGNNTSFNSPLIKVDDNEYIACEPVEDPVGSGHTPVVITNPANEVLFSGACKSSYTRYFIGEHPNWVTEHLDMWPDVFVGVIDYPGDTHEQVIGGQTELVNPGELPQFRDPNTYQLRARDGMVIFPETIDSVANPVMANYAYLDDIHNVTGQVLDVIESTDGLQYRADVEQAYPNSHGKRWVGRDDANTPVNIYVDGQLMPVMVPVVAETMGVKTE